MCICICVYIYIYIYIYIYTYIHTHTLFRCTPARLVRTEVLLPVGAADVEDLTARKLVV